MGEARVGWVGFLLLLSWSLSNGGVVGEEYVKYKDPEQPVAVRVKDLLSRMTLEEKIGQMVQIDRVVATSAVMKNYYIGNTLLFVFVFVWSVCLPTFAITIVTTVIALFVCLIILLC